MGAGELEAPALSQGPAVPSCQPAVAMGGRWPPLLELPVFFFPKEDVLLCEIPVFVDAF